MLLQKHATGAAHCCCFSTTRPRRLRSRGLAVQPQASLETPPRITNQPTQQPEPTSISFASQPGPNPNAPEDSKQPSLQGSYLSLVGVSLLWGTYGPSVSWLLHNEHAMPAPMLTALRTVMSAVVMLGITYVNSRPIGEQGGSVQTEDHIPHHHSDSMSSGSRSSSNSDAMLVREPHEQHMRTEQAQTSGREHPGSTQHENNSSVPFLARTIPGVIPAGIELGLWNFLGTALAVTGLEFTSPTRAGFLIQLTAVGTPMMAALAGIPVPKRTIAAALIALSGTCLISLDDTPTAAISSSSLGESLGGNLGDLLFIGACLFFSLATMRLSLYAPQHSSVQLATSKKVTLGVLSMAWLAATTQESSFAADWADALWRQTPFEWVVITCSALGPGALAAFLQTSGQARVPATMAQVIYSLTPLWSAIGAWLVLGDEAGGLTWAGGAIILGASLLATGGDGEAATDSKGKELKKL
uniref:EamA domain-containing protein n=1 Tax=Dunaliella tertiolecta TaxID=3047 RepID=A0A7S3QZR9_DUNTE|mmetsp:Transcript_20256/g.56437  ORF Transcript_20256/g.56437 Transcript_20256/m.56437 type:complete len:470 (+) Transcript_20256:133-1542(+)